MNMYPTSDKSNFNIVRPLKKDNRGYDYTITIYLIKLIDRCLIYTPINHIDCVRM